MHLSLKKSVHPDLSANDEASHLDLHCLTSNLWILFDKTFFIFSRCTFSVLKKRFYQLIGISNKHVRIALASKSGRKKGGL